MSAAAEALVPVTSFFPTRSPRWVADQCRAGRIPRVVKIGRVWVMRASDVYAWVAAGAGGAVPSVDAATADLRARGVIS